MFYRSGNDLQAQESEYGSYKAQTFHKHVSIVAAIISKPSITSDIS